MKKRIIFLVTVFIAIIDQLIKLAVYNFISEGGNLPFIGNIINLTYVKNTGAAYSLRTK